MRYLILFLLISCGKAGNDGIDGKNGTAGKDGKNCSIEQVSNGAVISCPDSSPVVIMNGTNGTNGVDGISGTVIQIIDPCGNGPGFDEILLRLDDVTLIAYFESGSNRFLARLEPGYYQTTDSQHCNFHVDGNMEVL